MKRFVKESYTWKDFLLVPMLAAFGLTILGDMVGDLLLGIIYRMFHLPMTGEGFLPLFGMYLMTIGVWIVFMLVIALRKGNKPILQALSTRRKGNSLKYLGLGLLVGFLMNGASILSAVLHQDIHLEFDSFQPLLLMGMLVAVFIQSSSEELVCRVYVYQKLRKGYKSPWVAIIGNALLFMSMHFFNPGIGPIAALDLFLSGLMFSILVYYTDGVWMAMGVHTAWNFTQNIIFGLPNSGIVSSFSVFKLVAASARDSIFYNAAFGVEGTVFSVCVMVLVCAFIIWKGQKSGQVDTDIWQEDTNQKEV